MQSINDRRLTELNAQVQSLEARQAEQQSVVEQLRRKLAQATEADLNAEATALQSGSARTPKAAEG
jgi:predicted RNase H-like nuclease (RuvC/YqgF family)